MMSVYRAYLSHFIGGDWSDHQEERRPFNRETDLEASKIVVTPAKRKSCRRMQAKVRLGLGTRLAKQMTTEFCSNLLYCVRDVQFCVWRDFFNMLTEPEGVFCRSQVADSVPTHSNG